ncbi:expressed conserved protein [Echinococcus multilocularis]|uniref:Expressed conserved protein n=1 Tax=Echinococcus multilocularis TaxID=6211 RepID=A0A068YCF2_ECHMU|nr:expressed conserved protein [Echinococcus multilocularis]
MINLTISGDRCLCIGMEISLEPSTYLNEANYYERKSERALLNMSKFIDLVENNYADAVNSLQKALSYLDKAKSELNIDSDELRILEMRQESLHRQFDALRPYRFLLTHRFITKTTVTSSQSVNSRLLKSADPVVRIDESNDHFHSGYDLLPSRSATNLKLCPKRNDQRLEECEVRINELEKMVNELSLKLEESERRAALEENARLVAEGELLMLRRPHCWGSTSPLTDSVYNTMIASHHSCVPELADSNMGT